MSFKIFNLISKVSWIMAVITLIIAVILLKKYRIPSIIGEITGSTARKSIEKIRKKNESIGKYNLNNEQEIVIDETTTKYNNSNNIVENQVDDLDYESLKNEKNNFYDSSKTTNISEENYTEDIYTKKEWSEIYVIHDITYIHTNEIID